MEFNFETPLILRLRKMAGKPLTLVLSIFSFLLAAAFSIYLVNSINIIYGICAALCLVMSIVYLSVFCSVKKCDKPLKGSAFSFGAITSILGILVLIAAWYFMNENLFGIVTRLIKNFSHSNGMPAFEFYAEAGAVFGVLFFISAFFTFISAKNTASKNYPHKAAGIIWAIVCFISALLVIGGAVTLILLGGYKHFILDNSHIYYSAITLLIFVNLILGGVFALNIVKASGVK